MGYQILHNLGMIAVYPISVETDGFDMLDYPEDKLEKDLISLYEWFLSYEISEKDYRKRLLKRYYKPFFLMARSDIESPNKYLIIKVFLKLDDIMNILE